ncbi:MAG: MFS transporter [Thermoplasmatales archaeon]
MIEKTKGHFSFGRNVIFAIFIILSATFFIRSSNNMMITSTPLLAKYFLGFSQKEVGLITALSYFITFITTSLINTRLSSKERRIAFISSMAVYAFTFIGFWKASSITLWFLVAISGAALGLIMPNIMTSAGLFNERKVREMVLSLYTVSLSLSLVVGPAVESYVLRFISLRESFMVFSSFALIALIISPFLAFPDEGRQRIKVKVLSNVGFRMSLINIISYNVPFTILVAFGGIYEHERFGASLSLISILFSLFFLSSFISRLTMSFLPPRRLARNMVAAMILTITGILFMVFSNNILYFAISLLILGIPHGLTYPLSILSLARSYKPEERNVANSYFFSFMTGIGIVVPTIGGFLMDTYGYNKVFLGILFMILTLLMMLAFNVKIAKNMTYESV